MSIETEVPRKLGCGCLLLSTRLTGVEDPEQLRQLPKEPSILLFQRGFGAPTFGGCLGGPGGILEADRNENPAEAAAREAKEEANIDFRPDGHAFFKGEMPDRDLLYFIGDWSFGAGGIRHADHEAIGHLWVTGAQAQDMDLSFQYKNAILKLMKRGLL